MDVKSQIIAIYPHVAVVAVQLQADEKKTTRKTCVNSSSASAFVILPISLSFEKCWSWISMKPYDKGS